MKKKGNRKNKKNDEQNRGTAVSTRTRPQTMPGRDQEAHRVPNTNPTTGYNRNWDVGEEDDTRERKPA